MPVSDGQLTSDNGMILVRDRHGQIRAYINPLTRERFNMKGQKIGEHPRPDFGRDYQNTTAAMLTKKTALAEGSLHPWPWADTGKRRKGRDQ